jgi:hypothetical protein
MTYRVNWEARYRLSQFEGSGEYTPVRIFLAPAPSTMYRLVIRALRELLKRKRKFGRLTFRKRPRLPMVSL